MPPDPLPLRPFLLAVVLYAPCAALLAVMVALTLAEPLAAALPLSSGRIAGGIATAVVAVLGWWADPVIGWFLRRRSDA